MPSDEILGDEIPDSKIQDSHMRNPDQLAVQQYFNSPTYYRTVHQIDSFAANAKDLHDLPADSLIPGRRTVINTAINAEEFHSRPADFQTGCGVWLWHALLLWMLAAMVPIAIEICESTSLFRSADYVAISLVAQTIGLPVLTSLAFFVVFSMLWHRSIIVRFAIAGIGSLIALTIFCTLIMLVAGESYRGMVRILDDVFPVLFIHFLVSGLIGLGIQFFTPWTLIEGDADRREIAATGVRWMIELTAISAVCFAILVNLDLNKNLVGLFIFGGFSLGGSFIALSVIRTGLSLQELPTWTRVASPAFALAYTLFFNGMIAIEQYKNSINWRDAIMILVISIYGATIVMAVSMAHARIAKACGWTLVRRGKG